MSTPLPASTFLNNFCQKFCAHFDLPTTLWKPQESDNCTIIGAETTMALPDYISYRFANTLQRGNKKLFSIDPYHHLFITTDNFNSINEQEWNAFAASLDSRLPQDEYSELLQRLNDTSWDFYSDMAMTSQRVNCWKNDGADAYIIFKNFNMDSLNLINQGLHKIGINSVINNNAGQARLEIPLNNIQEKHTDRDLLQKISLCLLAGSKHNQIITPPYYSRKPLNKPIEQDITIHEDDTGQIYGAYNLSFRVQSASVRLYQQFTNQGPITPQTIDLELSCLFENFTKKTKTEFSTIILSYSMVLKKEQITSRELAFEDPYQPLSIISPVFNAETLLSEWLRNLPAANVVHELFSPEQQFTDTNTEIIIFQGSTTLITSLQEALENIGVKNMERSEKTVIAVPREDILLVRQDKKDEFEHILYTRMKINLCKKLETLDIGVTNPAWVPYNPSLSNNRQQADFIYLLGTEKIYWNNQENRTHYAVSTLKNLGFNNAQMIHYDIANNKDNNTYNNRINWICAGLYTGNIKNLAATIILADSKEPPENRLNSRRRLKPTL
ncbi:MAG: hypothetical protein ACOYK8_10800 [Alphaproteobacteria bacterium]